MDKTSSVIERKNCLLSVHESFTADLHDIATGVRFVSTPKCGALFTFSGVVRDTDVRFGTQRAPEPIKGIYYEGYRKMVEKEVEKLIQQKISGIKVVDRTGKGVHLHDIESRCWVSICINCFVPAGMPHIKICLSSQKRDFGHHAIMDLLEQIKKRAPIWKKIVFCDGHEEWLQPAAEAS